MIAKILTSLILASTIQAQANNSKLEAGNYAIDSMHSKVGFEIPHLVISTVEGVFKDYSGSLVIGEKFEKTKLEAEVKIDSIDTSVSDRDNHLKSADFFDSQKFPKMTFKSSSISGSPESFKLTGDLTIKGKTKKVTFEGNYKGSAVDAYGNTKAAFSATTKINRQDFGLTWGKMVEAGPVVGDMVTINLKIQAAKLKTDGKSVEKK